MGGLGFLLILVAFGFLYFVIVRPQRRRQVEQQRMLSEVDVGQEIVTAGGIYGEVTELRDDDVSVRIAPEVEIRLARRAIAGIVTPPADELEQHDELQEPDELEEPDEPAEEPEHEPDASGSTPGP
jgi:preprotein translocase subunit YajC